MLFYYFVFSISHNYIFTLVSDKIRTGAYNSLYPREYLLSGTQDAGNMYARGRYSVGREIIEPILDRLGRIAERTDDLQGIVVTHSLGGGTGSGLTSLLMESIRARYAKKVILQFPVLPDKRVSDVVIEPYNAVLATHSMMSAIDCSFLLDNGAIFKICHDKLDMQLTKYNILNELIAQAMSSITAPLRFEDSIKVDLAAITSDLVIRPRLQFQMITYAPIITPEQAKTDITTAAELTNAGFKEKNQLLECDAENGKYMACSLLYRGDVSAKDVSSSISQIITSKTINFVDWAPTDIKVGFTSKKPTAIPGGELGMVNRSVCMLGNNTAVVEAWSRLNKQFDVMFKRRAFVDQYIAEGMEETEFTEAREDMEILEKEYLEATTNSGAEENNGEYPSTAQ